MNPLGADIIYDARNFAVTQKQLNHYGEKVQDRFPSIGDPLYAGGYVSYFDITPDLKFIIGRDGKLSNLIHCLGGGQALKYAPVFGELVKGLILDSPDYEIDLTEFSIERFYGKTLSDLWSKNSNQLNPQSL
jgi:glycine/D-amino acid oxidase-like deaminating enzyme